MAWLLAAKVGLSTLQASTQAKRASQQNIAENKMIQAYNSKVMQSTLNDISQINLQRAQLRSQTAGAIYNAQIQGNSARDQITLQAGATETIGASVRDAVSTVNQKQGQAVGAVQDQFMQAIDQSNLMLDKTVQNGIWGMRDAQKDTQGAMIRENAMWDAAGSVLGYAAGNYLNSSPDASAQAPISQSVGSKVYDYQGLNTTDPLAGQHPFGMRFGFSTNNLLGN